MLRYLCYFFKGALYLIGGGIVLTAGFASYLAFAQPAFHFPKPMGSYAVGTKTYHLVDENYINAQGDEKRKELMVQAWYPAQGELTEYAEVPYAPYLVDYLKRNQKLAWLVAYSRPMYSYALPEVEIATNDQRYPVIIFSHGLGGTRNHGTAFCEELASHGYVVLGISHFVGGSVVQFPDGRCLANNPQAKIEELVKDPVGVLVKENRDIEVWVEEVQFVLDQLEEATNNQISFLHGHIDMHNIGMFGHSFGGAASVQLCCRDKRIMAAVNMDGALYGWQPTLSLQKPFMFLLQEKCPDIVDQLTKFGAELHDAQEYTNILEKMYLPAIDQLVQEVSNDIYKITFKYAGHNTFCDVALVNEACLLSRFLDSMGTGSLNGFTAIRRINEYLVSFFDKYLKGEDSGLLKEREVELDA